MKKSEYVAPELVWFGVEMKSDCLVASVVGSGIEDGEVETEQGW